MGRLKVHLSMENVMNGRHQTVEQRVDEMQVSQQCKKIFMEVSVSRREQKHMGNKRQV